MTYSLQRCNRGHEIFVSWPDIPHPSSREDLGDDAVMARVVLAPSSLLTQAHFNWGELIVEPRLCIADPKSVHHRASIVK